MTDFEAMYYLLFNSVTDALELLSAARPKEAARALKTAQRLCEEKYISAPDDERGGQDGKQV